MLGASNFGRQTFFLKVKEEKKTKSKKDSSRAITFFLVLEFLLMVNVFKFCKETVSYIDYVLYYTFCLVLRVMRRKMDFLWVGGAAGVQARGAEV